MRLDLKLVRLAFLPCLLLIAYLDENDLAQLAERGWR
jgi:hypothetical protein